MTWCPKNPTSLLILHSLCTYVPADTQLGWPFMWTRSSSLLEHIIFTTSSYIEVLGFVPAVWSRGRKLGHLVGGSPFFFSKCEVWRKIAGVDDSAWNLCRRIENCRRYSPYLDIFISWKHSLTIQDGTPVFEEERWRALAITKRCIIVLGRNWVTLSIPVRKLQSWGIKTISFTCKYDTATVCSLIAKVTLQQTLPCPNVSGPWG